MSDTESKFHDGQLVKFHASVWPELADNFGIIVDLGVTQNSCVRIYVALKDGHTFCGVNDIVYGYWPVSTLGYNMSVVDTNENT